MSQNNEMIQEIINLVGIASDFLNSDELEDKELVEGCLNDALFDLEQLAKIAVAPVSGVIQ